MSFNFDRPLKVNYKSLMSVVSNIGKPLFFLILFGISVIFLLSKYLYNLFSFTRNIKLNISKLLLAGLGISIVLITSFGILLVRTIYELPSPDALRERNINASTKIYDRNGVLLYTIYKDENRTLVDFEEIPQHVKLATLAAEDAEFFNHSGYSIKGMSRAVAKFVKTKNLTGGSTITQQLVKNALLTPEKTFSRKLKELLLAIGVEHKYTKNEILTMYLNEVSYGGTAYGIKEAAHYYFDKNLSDLTIAEAAMLAGLTKSPTTLSPFGSHPDAAKARQENILSLMHKHGFITKAQMEKSKAEDLQFASNEIDIKAPHFVMYIKELLAKEYGEAIHTLGLDVYTTLDYETQKAFEEIIATEIDSLASLNVTNGAGMIIEPKSGSVLAMVGSKDYFDETIDGNVNVLFRQRQPGSSIKPINYAYALSNGSTPATVIDDSPVTFKIKGSPDYKPQNYDGKYRGKITLRSALAESRNIPAVKTLANYGVDKMIEQAEKMGITTWQDKQRYGLSLTLGGGDVKLADLTQAYQAIANQGKKVNLAFIKEVKNNQGKTIYEDKCLTSGECTETEVLDPKVAFQLTDILRDNKARTPAFGSHSALVIADHPEVAVKTGTSNDLRDNLTIGYNQNYLVSVWVGNSDNSPMSRVASGITGASPIWNKTMTYLLKDAEAIAWEAPTGLVRNSVCTEIGKFEDWFNADTYQDNCRIRTAEKDDRKLPPGLEKKKKALN